MDQSVDQESGPRPWLDLKLAGGERVDVRSFRVDAEMNALFACSLVVDGAPELDLDALLGQDATFSCARGPASGWHAAFSVSRRPADGWHAAGTLDSSEHRSFSGIVSHVVELGADDQSASYRLTLVPRLWLLTQRRNYRIFQDLSEIEIAERLLSEWRMSPELRLARRDKKRGCRVQYGESDFDFLARMLEEAGVAFWFEDTGAEAKLVIGDAPQENVPRGAPLPFRPSVGDASRGAQRVTSVEIERRVRPGVCTVRGHDENKPSDYVLTGAASDGLPLEQRLEQYHYEPGAFLYEGEGGARSDQAEAELHARRRLAAERSQGARVRVTSSAIGLWPGAVFALVDHARAALNRRHLVVSSSIRGTPEGEWTVTAECVDASERYCPPRRRAKPRVQGVESATVVGPPGEEIHTDELGRVCVRFRWDRETVRDENSSCFLPVSQPWGGVASLPRVGQEVLVDFIGGDPDRPVVTGRVHSIVSPAPYALPAHKTQSGLRTRSTGGGDGYNEIKFEDACGSEMLSVRAERDLRADVRHDETSIVGNDRSHVTGGNKVERVEKRESVTVMGSRRVTVMSSMAHWVQGDITATSAEGSTFFDSARAYVSSATNHVFESLESIELVCGASRIVLTPDRIVIDGPIVEVKPSPPE